MIQPLRLVHRRAFGVLFVVLPAILFAGLVARRPPFSRFSRLAPAPGVLTKQSEGLWHKHSIRSEFYRDSHHAYVELWPTQDLGEPDLLLYWIDGTPREGALPAGARLLGTFAAGKAFILPRGDGAGSLALYSLARQNVVDTATLEKQP